MAGKVPVCCSKHVGCLRARVSQDAAFLEKGRVVAHLLPMLGDQLAFTQLNAVNGMPELYDQVV